MNALEPLLEQPVIKRLRRNHALEHATIHVLSRRFRGVTLVGRSDARGFVLYGEVPTVAVAEAADEALKRMRAGEHHLAVHPNCGTNFVTMGVLGGLAATAALVGARGLRAKFGRLPTVFLATTAALILAQPLGLSLQQHVTTLSDPGGLEIAGVTRLARGALTVHRVDTAS